MLSSDSELEAVEGGALAAQGYCCLSLHCLVDWNITLILKCLGLFCSTERYYALSNTNTCTLIHIWQLHVNKTGNVHSSITYSVDVWNYQYSDKHLTLLKHLEWGLHFLNHIETSLQPTETIQKKIRLITSHIEDPVFYFENAWFIHIIWNNILHALYLHFLLSIIFFG